ncbi:MAG TPA: hypothetical protein VNK26_00465 [Pyrinomonadaceae bacterium]|nr:hypothetical protein [Pyrinomonadaceae bacterium]
MRLVFATILFILANAVYAFSQVPVDDPFPDFGRNRDRSEETRMIREMLSKQESAREKKKFAELQQRGEQALIIAKEINESFAKNKTLTASDRKKLDELEKLIKKLQDNLGADFDNSDLTPDSKSLDDAITKLFENVSQLNEQIKKMSRFSVSVEAIETSNDVLTILNFIKTSFNQK